MAGKCPKCDKPVGVVNFNGVDARESFGMNSWKAVTFTCPSCTAVLGVQIDPIAIKTDIVKDLVKLLRK
jgi:hypothetical protein